MRTTMRILSLVVALAVAEGGPPALAIPLSTLVNTNGGIQQGDLLFSSFNTFPFVIGGGNIAPLSPSGIDVQGITVSGEHGLRFSGPFEASFTPEGSIAVANYTIFFDVNDTKPDLLLHDVRHSYAVTHSGGGFEDRNVTATTDVKSCPQEQVICFGPNDFQSVGPDSSLGAINPPPSPTNINNNEVLPRDVNFLSVKHFMSTQAGSQVETATQSVSFPFMDVTFSQTGALAPEPSTIFLLGSGLMGLWSFRKKVSK